MPLADDSDDRIKDIMSRTIRDAGPDRIKAEASSGSCDNIMREIFSEARVRAAGIASSDRTDAVLATSLLHYMLTLCLVPSQRKAACKNGEIDIVVPGLRELKADPKNALAIMISSTPDISDMQPHSENIWTVFSKYDSRSKAFAVDESKGSLPFFHIVDMIRAFASERVSALKIFGI